MSNEKNLRASWDEFEAAFNCQLLYKVMKAMKRTEFYSFKQGDMSMVDFESYCIALYMFILGTQPSEEEKSRLLEKAMISKYHDQVPVQMRYTFREVVDSNMIAERNYLAS